RACPRFRAADGRARSGAATRLAGGCFWWIGEFDMRFVMKTVITAVALWIATIVLSGITLTGHTTWKKVLTLIGVALIFGIINAVLKPIIKVIGCGFYVLTLGLVALVVNALLFLLAGEVAHR